MDANQIIREITETFLPLFAIPHPSGQDQALSTHLADLLRSRGGTVEADDHWNLRCDFPATAGLESAPLVCFQGHLDTLAAPASDSTPCRVQDDHLVGDGYSPLGAGSLLAITAALWLLQQPFAHGPVRVLLTTGGEQAMTGAQNMDPHWLDEVRYLIGTDGIRADQLAIGASGGCFQSWSRNLTTSLSPAPSWQVHFTNFPGGYSATEMGKGVVNPIRLLCNLLIQSEAQIIHLTGGGALNTIPSTASAIMTIKNPNLFVHWQALVQSLGGQMDFAPSDVPSYVWSPIDYQSSMDFLFSLPNGITAYLPNHPMLPACSGNLGRVECADNRLTYHMLLRGTPDQALDRTARSCGLLADRCGFDPAGEIGYPTWEENPDNPLAQRMSQLWQARHGAPMDIDPTHAGSELSVLLRMRPELTAVETGITIEQPYSIHERIDLTSLPDYIQLLQDTLEEIARKG